MALPAHLQGMAAKMEASGFRYTVIDVTPAGYGPEDPSPTAGETTEARRLKNSIAEARTLLRGNMPAAKRAAIAESIVTAQIKLKAVIA